MGCKCATPWIATRNPTGEGKMDRGLALALLKTQEAALKAKGVAHLYLFGSVARNDGDKASDVDVAFDLQPDIEFDAFDMGGVMLDLADLLEQKVDLVERRSFSPEFEKAVGSDLIQIF